MHTIENTENILEWIKTYLPILVNLDIPSHVIIINKPTNSLQGKYRIYNLQLLNHKKHLYL